MRGRDFTNRDNDTPQPPGILSASAARTYFPKGDAVGRLLRFDEKTSYRIIGVAEDAKYADVRDQSPRTLYVRVKAPLFCNLVIRGAINKAAAATEVRTRLKKTGKDIRAGSMTTMTEQIDDTLATERLIAMLASFFALLAMLLVAIGLYGVVGYTAARRTNELGVRLALGATPGSVLSLVLREGMLLCLGGVAAGVPTAILGGRIAASMLYGVAPNDPQTIGATVLLLLTVAALAGLAPALRAARLDPISALRYE